MPLPDLEDEEEFEVEEVKDKTIINGQIHYLVKWEGWPTEYNQWIPEEDMDNSRQAIQRYDKQQKRRHGQPRSRDQSRALMPDV
jgi:hypothetical protein